LTLAVIHGLVTVKETDSRYRIMFVDSENNTFSFQSNNGDLVPLKPLGINHVHRPTHAPPAPASVNQGVSISARMRSIAGCLSYLVNMTRPDLAFTYAQLSKFVKTPGPVHLAAAERALAYRRGIYNEDITYCDPGEERRDKLTGWVDSDFATDPDTRKSMTGYLFSLNGGAVSWRRSRQGGVTLSNAEAEFVAASQAGQEAVYLRALLRPKWGTLGRAQDRASAASRNDGLG
jgi:hypothetical protein